MVETLQKCTNCQNENPLYSLTCYKCNAFLRAKIPNIDFWDVTWKIFYEPRKSFIKIIQAEKKNYLFIISILFLLRFSTMNFIIDNYKFQLFNNEQNNYNNFFITSIFILIIVVTITFIIGVISKYLKLKTRFKDNFSIIIFSSIPNILAFLFLMPFQIALFGIYWFTANPLPTIIKPFVSYVFYTLEFIFLIWNIILTLIAIKTQISNNIISFSITLIFYSLITIIIVF